MAGRLVLLLGAVVLIGLVTAAFGHFVLGAFSSFGEAVWSATAHLVDPGAIGDDSTGAERATGLIQVITGIIVFAGIVLTVLTEVIDRALRRLQQGDPGLKRSGHLLIVGFNESLGEVGARLTREFESVHPEIVVMLPPGQAGSRNAARQALLGYPVRTSVVVADPETEGFHRVCAGEARHIVILSPAGEPDRADLEAVGRATLLREHLLPFEPSAPTVAVELRRGRNTRALWYEAGPDSGQPVSRFPGYFDALVNDRNVGALLSLAVANPVFADTFLDEETNAPDLMAAGSGAGLSFGEARKTIPDVNILGILTGSGPAARAHYLPADDRRIEREDRLIVLPDSRPPADSHPAADPHSVKVAPTRPGPLLLVGWSDASRALIEDLEAGEFDFGRVHLLSPVLPPGFADLHGGGRFELSEGNPSEPDDVTAAIQRVEPGIIFIAAAGDSDAGAIISGMLALRNTDVPIVVEQLSAGRDGQTRQIADGLTVVSTSGILAGTVALSLADPAKLVVREQLLNNPGITLECLTYTGQVPLPLRDLPGIFSQAGSIPLAVSIDGDNEMLLDPGDHILTLRRVE